MHRRTTEPHGIPPHIIPKRISTQARADPRLVSVNITKCLFATAALMGFSFVTAPAAFAEPVEITKTTTTTGTVSEFGPGRIVIRSETEKLPLGYTFTKTHDLRG